jgi:hypothetical protein
VTVPPLPLRSCDGQTAESPIVRSLSTQLPGDSSAVRAGRVWIRTAVTARDALPTS